MVGIFTRYSTAVVAMISPDSPLIGAFMCITALEGRYEITSSLNIHVMHFKSF
jgi:hypothetical protein